MSSEAGETVWTKSGHHGESISIYHTDPECPKLLQAGKIRSRDRSVIPDRLRECKVCSGEAPQGHAGDYSYQRALKRAAREGST